MPQDTLDDFDRRLLRRLQRDARVSTQELAEGAGLSASPAWRRVKRMEEAGIIRAQVALLDPGKLGLNASAYVQVSLTDHAPATIARFDAFVQAEARIVDCARVTGGGDYLMKVLARDTGDFEDFLMHRLLALGVVRATTTSFVLRQTKSTTELPLD